MIEQIEKEHAGEEVCRRVHPKAVVFEEVVYFVVFDVHSSHLERPNEGSQDRVEDLQNYNDCHHEYYL